MSLILRFISDYQPYTVSPKTQDCEKSVSRETQNVTDDNTDANNSLLEVVRSCHVLDDVSGTDHSEDSDQTTNNPMDPVSAPPLIRTRFSRLVKPVNRLIQTSGPG